MKIKSKKKFRPVRDLNPWPLWYWCGTLPTELTSQLGAGHYHNVGSCNKPMKWWIHDFKYIEIIYVNCGLRIEFGSDLRHNEHNLSSTENKASIFFQVFFFQSCASCATLLLLSQFDVICDLLLQKCKATCHLIFNCNFIIGPLSAFSAVSSKFTNTSTPMRDQERISPYNINTISTR